MRKEDWVWMPHPGHFICARDCRFHLNTYVGGYIVSTLGEYLPDESVREIIAESRGIKLKGLGDYRRADFLKKHGYEKIGADRLYETMVFKAKKSKVKCCPYEMASGSDVDFEGYNTATDAFKGHIEMCKKWARRK
jgi:hypothetical protein